MRALIFSSLVLCLLFVASDVLPAAASRARGGADQVIEFGGIAGSVIVAGGYQRPKPLPVFKNRKFCGPTVANETLIVGVAGELQNAAVMLRPRGGRPALSPGLLVLDNQQCAFRPHVQIGVLGGELLLKNSDPILHTVHARLGRETLFNVGLPKWREVIKRLDRVGVIRIDCDVLHTWMSAAVIVTDTPYFALTDSAGRFKIDGLPTGEYDMEVWHERLGARKQAISILAGGMVQVEFIYSAEEIR